MSRDGDRVLFASLRTIGQRPSPSAGLDWGAGASTGAKPASPDWQVACSIGNGSVMYCAGLWTQARYGIPLLTVVWLRRVRLAYHDYKDRIVASGRYAGTYLGDPNIDFARLAEIQGRNASGGRRRAGSGAPARHRRHPGG